MSRSTYVIKEHIEMHTEKTFSPLDRLLSLGALFCKRRGCHYKQRFSKCVPWVTWERTCASSWPCIRTTDSGTLGLRSGNGTFNGISR